MQETTPFQVLVISLERSLERRKKVEEQLSKTNIKWSFLNAVDGYTLSESPTAYKKEKVKRLQGYELTPGEIGCFLSHIQAWNSCVSSEKITLVFEDDFLIGQRFELVLNDLLSIANKWDLLRLSGIYETDDTVLVDKESYSLVQNLGEPCGTAAYILNPSAAQVLLNHAADIYEPVDHYLEHFKKHGLRCLAAKPYPIELADTKSTITDRPGREPITGTKKLLRSFYRFLDRTLSPSPWFPK